MKLNNQVPEGEPIVSMIEHTYRGTKHVMVATTRSVYIVIPKTEDTPPYLKPMPFEVKPNE